MRLFRNAAICALLGFASCVGVDVKDGTLACATDGECPPGYSCGADNECYRSANIGGIDFAGVTPASGDLSGAVQPEDGGKGDQGVIPGGTPDMVTCKAPSCCTASTQCGTGKVCDPTKHTCVTCAADTDCPLGNVCTANQCVDGCNANHGCAAPLSCCNNVCTTTATDVKNCGACGTACTAGQVCCTGTCASTATDAKNCGACGNACTFPHGTPACAGGACTGTCSAGYGDCDESPANGCEIDLTSSALNCTACGIPCSQVNAQEACMASACVVVNCATGFSDCNGDSSDGCEINVAADPQNCGACAVTCSPLNVATVQCDNGICDGPCATGFADCDNSKQTDGCEVATSSDPSNCGGCAISCASIGPNELCTAGACVLNACAAGLGDCDGNASNGCEAHILTDVLNCGSCGHACSPANATGSCMNGQCVVGACNQGYLDCNKSPADGCEVSTTAGTDPNNCGACGTVCSSNNVTPQCSVVGGTLGCNGPCATGYGDCNNNKKLDGCEVVLAGADAKNCGGCGMACSTKNITATCLNGQCNGTCASGYADCNSDKLTDGCEVFLAGADAKNCGACGKACSTQNVAAACVNGQCNGACASGYADCNNDELTDGCEVSLQSDSNNCGSCGMHCPAGSTCVMGGCSCASGGVMCSGVTGCVLTATDVDNCGGCGKACSNENVPVPACSSGTCSGACATGYADCDHDKQGNGCEVNLTTDVANCSACGKSCDALCVGQVATTTCNGACAVATCASGYTDFDGACANGCECALPTAGATCAAATYLGSVHIGGSVTRTSTLVPAGREAWYEVTFFNNTSPAFHPHITLSPPSGNFVFDLAADCAGTTIGCVPSGTVNGKTEWELGLDPNIGDPGSTAFVPIPQPGNGGIVFIRVYRTGALACDTFTLNITNGAAECDPRLTDCDAVPGCESNLQSGISSCGGCGKVCSTTNIALPACGGGVCTGACNSGYSDCDNDKLTNGCEVASSTDANNCGGCGLKCSATNVTTVTCANSICTSACATGFGDCNMNKLTDGCETNINTNPMSCGGCGVLCSPQNDTPACAGGICTSPCAAGFADCDADKLTDGCEVNLQTDIKNCGACGKPCSTSNIATVTCTAGNCNGSCTTGYADCNGNKITDGCETSITTASNCGACGAICSTKNIATPTCSTTGTCNGVCNAGYADCNNNKMNDGCEIYLTTDVNNCGSCGTVCTAPKSCVSGACM